MPLDNFFMLASSEAQPENLKCNHISNAIGLMTPREIACVFGQPFYQNIIVTPQLPCFKKTVARSAVI
jgi:hypothetical protein